MLDKVPRLPPDPVLGLEPHLLRASEVPLTAPILALGSPYHRVAAMPTGLAAWQTTTAQDDDHGVMTLRSMSGVILALFFFTVDSEAATAPVLQVPCLRVVELTGRHRTLRAALRTMVAFSRALHCRGVLLQADAVRAAGPEISEGLPSIGHAEGFQQEGRGWAHWLHSACRRWGEGSAP